MKYGIIANLTAKNGQPSFRGYDLTPKPKHKGYVYSELNDYELVFSGLSAEHNGHVSVDKLLDNYFKSADMVYEGEVEKEKLLTDLEEKAPEKMVINVNGSIIKKIVGDNGKYQAELKGTDVTEAQKIMQNMLDAWAGARIKRIDVEYAIITQLRKGTLDIALCKQTGEKILVEFTEKGPVAIKDSAVPVSKVKASIYFMLQPYKFSENLFLKHINCSHEVNGYIALYEKGKLYFEKKEGKFSDLEIAIAKDLIKVKV